MNSKKHTILIINDIESHQYLLKKILSEEGYDIKNIVIENNVQNALFYIEERKFDLILLDLQMPKVDELHVNRIIKSGNVNRNTPVIILSEIADAKSIKHSIAMGVADYIVKPVNINDIKNKIKIALI